MKKLLLIITAIWLLGLNTAPEQRQIKGHVQFWERVCDETGECELPEAKGPLIEVDLLVSAPTSEFEVGHVERYYETPAYALLFQVYWKKSQSVPNHFVFQTHMHRDGKEIGSCSQYRGENEANVFPVGYCSVRDGQIVRGVTFYKQLKTN